MNTRTLRKFTQEDHKTLERLVKQNLSIGVIAERMQRPKGTIADKLRIMNVRKPKKYRTIQAEDNKYIVYLRSRGYYVHMLAGGKVVIDGVEHVESYLKHKYARVMENERLLHGSAA